MHIYYYVDLSGAAEVEDHPGYTMTRETITMTNQGGLMAINYGGWSADPDPEEEEVSIIYSLSHPILINAVSQEDK